MQHSARTALVTGGGGGIGKAIHRLARAGMAIGVLGVGGESVTAVAASINEAGGKAVALHADITDRAQVESAASQLRQFFGPIGVLINNAAIENFCAFAEIRDDNWDKIVNTNLRGTYIVTQTVLPDMLALGWGRIVNISALGAQTGAPTWFTTSPPKAPLLP